MTTTTVPPGDAQAVPNAQAAPIDIPAAQPPAGHDQPPPDGPSQTHPAETLEAALRFNSPSPPQPPQRPAKPSRARLALIAAAGTLLLAGLTVAAVIVLNGSSSKTTQNAVVIYQGKVTTTLAPVVTANQTLTNALQAIDGSQTTLHNAQSVVTGAQSSVTAARGAVAILTVPPSQTTLNQQVQQALTQEAGYLQGVSATLTDPIGQSSSQVRTLAANTQTAFVPIASVAPGAVASIGGVDNFLAWVSGANAAAKNAAAKAASAAAAAAAQPTTTIIQQPTTAVQQAPSSPPTASTSFSPGDENTSDGFASQCDTTMLIGPDSDCSVAEQVSTDVGNGSVNTSGGTFTDRVTDNANEPAANGSTITFGCSYNGSYYTCESGDPLDWFDFTG